MGITKDGKLKRRKTGGKPAQYMKKRKFHMGRPSANTKLGETRVHLVRCRGGYIKQRALRVDSGNYGWGSEGIVRKTRILSVVYNPTNNEFVRTNTIVKGEIVQVDATPFKLWYETYYGVAIGKKVVTKKVVKDAKAPAKSVVKGAAKGAAKPADASKPAAAAAKPAAAKDAKAAKPAAAKPAAKDAKAAKPAASDAKPAAKGVAKTIEKATAKTTVKAAAKGAAKGAVKAVAKAAAKGVKGAKAKAAKEALSLKDQKKVGPIAAKHTTAIANAVPGTLTGVFINQNASQIVRDKHAKRAKTRVLEPLFEEQFASGRMLACISSRPGQHGTADGYLLEGRELEFYLRKTGKKTRAAK